MNEDIAFIPECYNCVNKAICRYKDLYEGYIRNLEKTGREYLKAHDGIRPTLSTNLILHMCENYNWH